MSVQTQKNIMDVFVAKEVAPATYANVTSDLVATLTAGQIAVVGFNASSGYEEKLGVTTSNITNYPYIRFVKLTAQGELLYGARIYGKDVKKVSTKAGVAPSEQIWYIGYNGSTGSLDVSQANDFILTIAYDHDDMFWSEQKMRNAYDYYSASPTQMGLAQNMTAAINFKETQSTMNGTGRMVRAEIVSDGTAAVVTDGTQTQDAIVVRDSAIIQLVDTGTTTPGNTAGIAASCPVGTILNIAGIKYVVTAVSTNQVTLHTPYQGASATVTGGTTVASQFCKMSAISNVGIKITGQALTWRKDFFKFMKVKFHFDLQGFGATVITKSQESSKGIGYWSEVAEYESFASGNKGALNRTVIPLPIGLNEVPATLPAFSGAGSGLGANYNVWTIESEDSQNYSPITGTAPMKIQTFVFFPDGTQGDAQQADLVNNSNWNLDAWFTSAGFTLATV